MSNELATTEQSSVPAVGEFELDDISENENDEPTVSITLFESYTIEANSERARGQVASSLDIEINEKLTEGTRNYLEAGYFLHVMKESRMYRSLGDHIKNWSDYLSERGLSIATDNNLRGIATVFGSLLSKHPEFLKADYKRLSEVLTLFRTNPDALERYKERVLARTDNERVIDVTDLSVQDSDENELGVEPADEVIEERLKEQILYDAVTLPKKGWESQLKEVKGETPTDACAHDAEYDILYRCRDCGQLYSPKDGHSDTYKELVEKNTDELIVEYLDAIGNRYDDEARKHVACTWNKRSKKFEVNGFQLSAGVYSTDMNTKSYDKKGLANLIIELRQ